MQQILPSSHATTRDEHILTILHQATGMIRNLAINYHVEFDDLYQESALVVIETLDKAFSQTTRKPYAYLQSVIKMHFLQSLRSRHDDQESIDRPLYDDTDMTLADTLPAATDVPTNATQDQERAIRREQALFDALHRLPLEEQMYMTEVHDLNAFSPSGPGFPDHKHKTRQALSRGAYGHLRCNRALAQAVQA